MEGHLNLPSRIQEKQRFGTDLNYIHRYSDYKNIVLTNPKIEKAKSELRGLQASLDLFMSQVRKDQEEQLNRIANNRKNTKTLTWYSKLIKLVTK